MKTVVSSTVLTQEWFSSAAIPGKCGKSVIYNQTWLCIFYLDVDLEMDVGQHGSYLPVVVVMNQGTLSREGFCVSSQTNSQLVFFFGDTKKTLF